MLIRIQPEQVTQHWDFFAPTIGQSLPPIAGQTQRGMINILEAVLMEELVVWAFTDEEGDIKFVMCTHLAYEPVMKTRNCLIYSFTAFGEFANGLKFDKALITLTKYAKHNQCEAIIAYVENPEIKQFLESRGGKAIYTLVEMEI